MIHLPGARCKKVSIYSTIDEPLQWQLNFHCFLENTFVYLYLVILDWFIQILTSFPLRPSRGSPSSPSPVHPSSIPNLNFLFFQIKFLKIQLLLKIEII